jgi:signal transduction histidine kinase
MMEPDSALRTQSGLRLRFTAALFVVVTVIAAGFVYAVHAVVDHLEYSLLDFRLENELREFVAAYSYDPEMPLIAWGGLQRYVASAEQPDVPLPLQGLAEGAVERVELNGARVLAGRQDVDDSRLYVTLDVAPVEALEQRVLATMWATLALGYGLALVMALGLATLVTHPVSALARHVEKLDPRDRGPRLSAAFQGREVGVIAEAFDRFLGRMDAFVAREQAFTEDASHELRTPLSVILSSTQLLMERADLPPGADVKLRRIARAGEQMQSLIHALLFLAREDEPAREQHCDVGDVVREAMDACADLPEARGITLACGTVESCRVGAPEGITRCVVNNLLLNALTHTNRGRVDLSLAGGVLVVQDAGTGIPPQDLSRIFERRFRGAHSRGLGLGLYLVKRICDRLGWRIDVGSATTGGARFEVDFTAGLTKA